MGKIEVINALEQMETSELLIANIVGYLDDSSETYESFGEWAGEAEEVEEIRELLLGLWEQGYVRDCKKSYVNKTVYERDTYIYTD